GCRDALTEGPIGGFPVTGLRVTLTDGATHVKDSSEQAFRTAGGGCGVEQLGTGVGGGWFLRGELAVGGSELERLGVETVAGCGWTLRGAFAVGGRRWFL
ncbi:hypothetical protein, partial [Streptomyces sp. Agncl-13]|uniref:hypothetical protein n=1 Tax=Streptomyces sp. Agncl-13 TaxID=3400628 RepID=UPI003A8C7BF7